MRFATPTSSGDSPGCGRDAGQAWAAKLAATLERLNVAVLEAKRAGAPVLDREVLAGWQARYDALVAAGRAANPNRRAAGALASLLHAKATTASVRVS